MLAAFAAAALLTAAPVKITVTAPGHAPPVGVRWNYSVAATIGGRQVKGLITEVIVDPIGGTHPVQYGTTKKIIKNWPFKGVFRDFIVWPKSTRGIPVTWRITVVIGQAKRVVNYKITPHA
ncbi:MAG TPA: hypothetical protein VGH82_06225 [Gaiellaceae bacterium]